MLAYLARNLSFLLRITSSALEQLNTNIQSLTKSVDLVRKIFLKLECSTKLSKLYCALLMGHTSKP